jgi:serine/threonine-protein kinase
MTYHNPRFGTTADVPAGWQSGRPPDNGDGLVFTSPDGTAHLTISGGLNIWDSIEEAMEIYATGNAGETITYTHREARAITVSGTKGDLIFYAKHILSCRLSCRDQLWNSIDLESPAARKREFDPLVTHIAQSLRPGVSEQVDACNK